MSWCYFQIIKSYVFFKFISSNSNSDDLVDGHPVVLLPDPGHQGQAHHAAQRQDVVEPGRPNAWMFVMWRLLGLGMTHQEWGRSGGKPLTRVHTCKSERKLNRNWRKWKRNSPQSFLIKLNYHLVYSQFNVQIFSMHFGEFSMIKSEKILLFLYWSKWFSSTSYSLEIATKTVYTW